MNFYVTGGTLHWNARSYVERQADRELYESLLRGEFCYVLTSRQMGKSSLMVRTAARLREQGGRVVALDLTAVGGRELSSEQWYYGILDMLGEQLQLESELESCWHANSEIGPVQRLIKCIRHVALCNLPRESHDHTAQDPAIKQAAAGRLVVFVDEIDVVRSLPFSTDDFFAAIRECYNRRTQDPLYERLTFCLLGVASPSDLIRDPRTTPFNIGRRIELNDFTAQEALPLAAGLDEEAGIGTALAEACLNRILHWSGGHPYLTQRLGRECGEALRHAALERGFAGPREMRRVLRIVDQVCRDLFFEHRARERDDNLVFVRERLLRSGADVANLLDLYGQVRRGRRVPDDDLDPLVAQLRLSGIVRGRHGRLRERNRVYGRVFDPEWIRSHMPQAELRRQRQAWWRGVIWATALSAAVLTVLGILGLIAFDKNRQARHSFVQTQLAHARELRMIGEVGHRAASLQAIANAAALHQDKSILVNEALASLALPDLEPETTDPASWHTNAGLRRILPPAFDTEAVSDATGNITLHRIGSGEKQAVLPGMGWPVVRMEFDQEQRHGVVEYAGKEGPFLGVWNCQTQTLLGRLSQGIIDRAVDFSADGRWLALGQADGTIRLHELGADEMRAGEQLPLSTVTDPLNVRIPQVVRFHPLFGLESDCEILAASSADSTLIQTWDLRRSERRTLFFSGAVRDFCWHSTGRLLAAACDHRNIEVLVFRDRSLVGPERIRLTGHNAEVTAVAFNHRGDLLASIGADDTLQLRTLASDRVLSAAIPTRGFDRIWFNLNDRQLVASNAKGDRSLSWRVRADEYRVLSRHYLAGRGVHNPIWNLETIDISPEGTYLVAGSSASLTLWNLVNGRRLGDWEIRAGRGAAFGAQANQLWLSTESGLLHHPLHFRQGSHPRLAPPTLHPLHQVPDELGSLALTGDRNRAAVSHRNQILLVDLLQNTYATIPIGFHCHQIAISSDGEWIAGRSRGDEERGLGVWHAGTAVTVATPQPISASDHFAFSPDDRWLVVFSDRDQAWQFYGIETWEPHPKMRIETGHATSLQPGPFALSADGRLLAVVFARSSIRLYDLSADTLLNSTTAVTLESPDQRRLLRLLFSPDGRYLAAVAQDQTVQLWGLDLLRAGLEPLGLGTAFPGHTSR
jgi:WD40 repeat protein